MILYRMPFKTILTAALIAVAHGACYFGGKIVKDGDTFDVRGIVYLCDNGKRVVSGCQIQGRTVKVGETITSNGFDYTCLMQGSHPKVKKVKAATGQGNNRPSQLQRPGSVPSTQEVSQNIKDEAFCNVLGRHIDVGKEWTSIGVKYKCAKGGKKQVIGCVAKASRDIVPVGKTVRKCGWTSTCPRSGKITERYNAAQDDCKSTPTERKPPSHLATKHSHKSQPRKKVGDFLNDFKQGCHHGKKEYSNGQVWTNGVGRYKCVNNKAVAIGCVSPKKKVVILFGQEKAIEGNMIGTCRMEGNRLIFGKKLKRD